MKTFYNVFAYDVLPVPAEPLKSRLGISPLSNNSLNVVFISFGKIFEDIEIMNNIKYNVSFDWV